MNNYEVFSERFNESMEASDLTAADVSRRTGISKAMISRYKNGLYIPQRESLEKLAALFGVSLNWLIGDSDIMVPANKGGKIEVVAAEYELIKSYRKLSRANKALAEDFVTFLLQRQGDK